MFQAVQSYEHSATQPGRTIHTTHHKSSTSQDGMQIFRYGMQISIIAVHRYSHSVQLGRVEGGAVPLRWMREYKYQHQATQIQSGTRHNQKYILRPLHQKAVQNSSKEYSTLQCDKNSTVVKLRIFSWHPQLLTHLSRTQVLGMFS